jgi:hypothetical protein
VPFFFLETQRLNGFLNVEGNVQPIPSWSGPDKPEATMKAEALALTGGMEVYR